MEVSSHQPHSRISPNQKEKLLVYEIRRKKLVRLRRGCKCVSGKVLWANVCRARLPPNWSPQACNSTQNSEILIKAVHPPTAFFQWYFFFRWHAFTNFQ